MALTGTPNSTLLEKITSEEVSHNSLNIHEYKKVSHN